MDHYSSCIDEAFLARSLALYRSLVRHGSPFRWWVLCFGESAYQALCGLSLEGVVPIREEEVMDDELERIKRERSTRLYYFSCKPWVLSHVFDSEGSATRVTYLDGDLYFFSSPAELDRDIAGASVAITPHHSARPRFHERFGLYNSGWVAFARNDDGLGALRWWRDRCVEAVTDYPVGGVFGDQKYLEEMHRLFDRVVPIAHQGANLAPWNADGAPLHLEDGRVFVDKDPLVFFHFHGLAKKAPGIYDPGWSPRGTATILRDAVYRPYLEDLVDCESEVERITGRARGPRPATWGFTRPRSWWWRAARSVVRTGNALASRRLIVVRRNPSR